MGRVCRELIVPSSCQSVSGTIRNVVSFGIVGNSTDGPGSFNCEFIPLMVHRVSDLNHFYGKYGCPGQEIRPEFE